MLDIFKIRIWFKGNEAGFHVGWAWFAIFVGLIWWWLS